MIKTDIRRHMMEQRASMRPKDRKKQHKSMIAQIREDQAYKEASMIAIFHPMKDEIDLLPLLKDKKTFCLPKVEMDGIHFYRYQPSDALIKSTFGIMEPAGDAPVDHLIEYMLVPALAIDQQNYRIGYGKGYYDRFLSMTRPKHVVGVVYDFQFVDELPHDANDIRLDRCFKGDL